MITLSMAIPSTMLGEKRMHNSPHIWKGDTPKYPPLEDDKEVRKIVHTRMLVCWEELQIIIKSLQKEQDSGK